MGKIDINRSVHLALRDKNYEEVLSLFKYALEGRALLSRKKIINAMKNHILTAYQEADFATRGIVVEQEELDFIRFLRIFLEAVAAAANIIGHEEILNQDRSFLNRFLTEDPELISEFRKSHRARALAIVSDLKMMNRAAERKYSTLKKGNYETLSPDEQRRYTLTYRGEGGSRITTPR
jgi:hypothetical protein